MPGCYTVPCVHWDGAHQGCPCYVTELTICELSVYGMAITIFKMEETLSYERVNKIYKEKKLYCHSPPSAATCLPLGKS